MRQNSNPRLPKDAPNKRPNKESLKNGNDEGRATKAELLSSMTVTKIQMKSSISEQKLKLKNNSQAKIEKPPSLLLPLVSVPNYRFVQPLPTKEDVSMKFWLQSNENPSLGINSIVATNSDNRPRTEQTLKRSTLSRHLTKETSRKKLESMESPAFFLSPKRSEFGFPESIDNFDLYGDNMPAPLSGVGGIDQLGINKPFTFFSNIGGRQTSIKEIIPELNLKKTDLVTTLTANRRNLTSAHQEDPVIFTDANVDKPEKSRLSRPQTGTQLNNMPSTTSLGIGFPSAETGLNLNSNGTSSKPIRASSSSQNLLTKQSNRIIIGKPPVDILTSAVSNRPGTANILSGVPKAKLRVKTAQSRGASSKLGFGLSRGDEMHTNNDFDENFEELDIKEDVGDNEEFYINMENAKNLKQRNLSSKRKKFSSRPISGRSHTPQEFFTNFTKFTNFTEMEQTYEELFDRNERTLAATFAKFGDLSFYSPIQRIGSYMQYSAKLKKEHLIEITNLQNTITSVEKPEYEIPIQLTIIDDSNPFQSMEKTGISTTFQLEDMKRIPVTLSLYPEYIEPQIEDNDYRIVIGESESTKAARIYFNRMLKSMNGNYDPEYIGRESSIYIDPSFWPKSIFEKVMLSYYRYKHYVTSDQIKYNEISKYKKEWITNALSLIPEYLLKQYEDIVRGLFQEIFSNYKTSMKEAILNYILRSPEERKRLNITLLVRPVMCSAERIAREGGYCSQLYPDWHQYIINGKSAMKSKLHIMNIVNSAILDWYEDFSSFSLYESDTIKALSAKGYSLSVASFAKIQNTLRQRTVALLKHIFYRGVILILKKYKYLRRKGTKKGFWTYNGFKEGSQKLETKLINPTTQDEVSSIEGSQIEIGDYQLGDDGEQLIPSEEIYAKLLYDNLDAACKFQEGFDNMNDIQSLDELMDIRENSSYKVYSILCDATFNYSENGYKLISKQERKNLRTSTKVLTSLLLRRVIERSIENLEKSLLSIPTFSSMEHLDKSGMNNILETSVDSNISGNSHKALSRSNISYSEYSLPKLNILNFQNMMFPVLKIDMVFEESSLKFKESEEAVLGQFSELFNDILSSFKSFLQPEYTKIELRNNMQPQEEDEKSESNPTMGRKGMIQTLENFLSAEPDPIYSKFCQMIQLREKNPKKPKGTMIPITEENEDQEIILFLNACDASEEVFKNSLNVIKNHLNEHYQEAKQSLQIFEPFKPFFHRNIDKETKAMFQKEKFIMEDYQQQLTKIMKYEKLLDTMPNNIFYPLFEVNCRKVKKWIANSIGDLKRKIMGRLEKNIMDTMRGISEKYTKIVAYIRRSTTTPEEVAEMEKYLYDLNSDRVGLMIKSKECYQKFMAILKLEYKSHELFNAVKEIYEWPANLDKELKSVEERHQVERAKLEEKLREKRSIFSNKMDVLADEVKNFESLTEYKSYKKYIDQIKEFENEVNEALNEMNEINEQEKKLFGYPSNFEKMVETSKKLIPYSELWNTIGEFLDKKKIWMTSNIRKMDYNEVESIVKTNLKSTNKVIKNFDKNSITYRIASQFKEDVQQLNEKLPVIEVLCNPGLKDRHWDQIQEIIGNKFNYVDGSLKEILAKSVDKHLEKITELSDQASKEYKLENMLDKMEKDWQNLEFGVTRWKNSSVMILQGSSVEDIMQLLDDHTIKAQTIRSNPSVKFMEERAIRWEKLMLYLQEVLEIWVKVQSVYLYLEPIFSSEDINKQMPKEATKFLTVNNLWNDIMRQIEYDPLVLNIEHIPNLLGSLNTGQQLIEEIQKGLNDYLETKRLAFPRFFFLSNEDLLNILAETKDPLLVQPHLKKCFEGINELIFTNTIEIEGMRSPEKEEILFISKIAPRDYKSNVEQWLVRVEEQMCLTLQKVAQDSLNDLTKNKTNRLDWVKRWPGQIVICVSQIMWTFNVEEKLMKNGNKGIHSYYEELTIQLEDIVNLVRSDLTHLERLTLGALVVIEVHARDVVGSLAQDQVSEKNAFEWLSQMRYYFDQEEKKVNVQMITTQMDYGYEYLGNTARLVITPLTDRCYRTLMGALQLNLGGAPEGPAGTGKTETTKDLAKALAMQCVVFNCSDGLNSHSMAKFFKGLASAGAWSCFDEFNRIELEVLSVVAQQIHRIQQAKAANKSSFSFEGTSELELKKSCNIFITMNPGYAGRSELPDNLKALFRPVAMMVPDYAMIAEISLYSYGFVEARSLARKIVDTYKLCSEQLSSQDHYDYGMRAVKAVLTSAGQLKRKFGSDKEDVLIYRSICDVNIPKFLAQDIQLFMGIITDLFPGVKPSNPEYGILNTAITNCMVKMNLQNVPNFRKKILQLYEMISVRHGIMLVGQSFSGKTMSYRILAGALCEAAESQKGALDNDQSEIEVPAHYYVINPKSLAISQIYGYSDPISKEWTEGVLADIFRKCATSTLPDKQWIIFDGPVDADWIENMNTVLDDNKKLCLMNGEAIQMSNSMTMMFEVADLLQASPATVSRCGMIYMQPDNLGWWPIFQSWLTQFNQIYDSSTIKHMEDLFDGLISKCISFSKSKCTEHQTLPDANLVVSLMNLFKSLLLKYELTKIDNLNKWKPDDVIIRMDMIFIYSVIWSIGGIAHESGRKLFDNFLRKFISDPMKCEIRKDRVLKFDKASLPPESTSNLLQDYYIEEFKWKSWKEKLEKMDSGYNQTNNSTNMITSDMKFHDIIIPTTESLRIISFLNITIANEYPFLIIGPTGTGKSLFIGNYIKSLSIDTFLSIILTFSAQTTANQTQDIIEAKLEKRRKGVYGPPFGKKCLIFVDDLNMPAYDKYGAQPAIELLRQFMDHRGWYDKKERKLKEIIDSTIISAMGPPGGGRNAITPRMLRHYYCYSTIDSDEKTLLRIFTKIVDWHVNKNELGPDAGKSFKFAVEAATEVYLQSCEFLKPTPAKSHYLFNLRDLSRVIQGMLLYNIKKDSNQNIGQRISRSFLHEICRVFFDRLITDQDKLWFYNLLVQASKTKLREPDFKALFKQIDPEAFEQISSSLSLSNQYDILKMLRFGDLMSNDLNDKSYEELNSITKICSKIEEYLEEYNSSSKKPMYLVIFEFAVDHILRICRILKLARGHALLVGLGGSGRQSLTRLSAYICENEVFQIEVSKNYNFENWRNDVKRLMTLAGVDNKNIVFMISDSQLSKGAYILEDLNNLLNSGNVPNIFSPEEFVPFTDKLRVQAKHDGKEQLIVTIPQFYDYFVENIRSHLHVVLVLSSIGDSLRTRIRMFPSLINCCTYISYKPWPSEALTVVAEKFIAELGVADNIQRGMVNMCKYMHESIIKLSREYLKNENRYNYVTPTSYLELLSSLKNLLNTQKKKLESKRDGYTKGVERLLVTAEEVKVMQRELELKQPVLIQMKSENSIIAEKIAEEMKSLEPKRKQVEEEEEFVQGKVKEASEIKAECENELAAAKPIVEKAKKALKEIDPNDINLLKAMPKAPATVQLVMESVCILLRRPPTKIPKPDNPKEKIDSYWETSKKLLSEKNFIDSLFNFETETLDPAIMNQIRTNYISHTAEFNPKRVEKASSSAKSLCEWVLAIDKYEKILAVVRPKQQKFKAASEELEKLEKSLNEKRAEVTEMRQKIAVLEENYNETKQKQDELEADIILCEKKLKRAKTLIGSLGGERDRWVIASQELDQRLRFLVGDILLSAGTISYLGAFSPVYRNKCIKDWVDIIKTFGLEVSDGYNLEQCLGEPVKIRSWNLNGLPSDSFSRENGIIIEKAGRYSLMIDPQSQANKWIKNQETENGLKIIKQTDSDFLRVLENCIVMGATLLLENVSEDLDDVLEPILLKQTFKHSGVMSIKVGESIVPYTKTFRLYITTKLRNPEYVPEISTKITLVNFMITKSGLEDQLLEIAVAKEKPDLEEQRSKLIMQSHDNKRQLEEIENKILEVLQVSQGNILDNEEAIDVLSQSKVLSKEIEEKQKVAEVTEKKIEEARAGYRPIANHSTVLFFATFSLSSVDTMYQYSLNWFIPLYVTAFEQSEKSTFLQQRVNSIIEYFTLLIYNNVCRSLFEKDKLLFSFIMTYHILDNKKLIDPAEYNFFISPLSITVNEKMENPCQSWLPLHVWAKIKFLTTVSLKFEKLSESFENNQEAWHTIYNHPEAHQIPFPDIFAQCTNLQRLCILKALRPDKIIGCLRDFISKELGPIYITPPPFDIHKSFVDSVATQPLIFILPGTDPINLLTNFAEVNKLKHDSLIIISLGQGQGILAEKAIEEFRKRPAWVVLQNCHLAPSWMPKLEKICEFLDSKAGREQTHPSFRLWLTTYPSTNFPSSILQNSIKMTNEPPKGLKNNMLVSYYSDPISDRKNFFESHSKPQQFKVLLYGLCLFHAIIQERRNFGPIGWNIHYDFNQSDLRISVKQLHLFLDEYKNPPFKALHYVIGECNYGGRVTDDRDRRILKALMEDFFSEKIFQKDYKFSEIKEFEVPKSNTTTYEEYISFIENLPIVPPPEIYGFHQNANIAKELKETNEICNSLLVVGGGFSMQSTDGDEMKLKKICDEILAKLPKRFDPEIAQAKFPVNYNNSMNTVLGQEIVRYNTLTKNIQSTLLNIDMALKGTQVLSESLEQVCKALLKGLVPDLWKKYSYPSLKSLGAYIQDLLERLQYFQKWLDTKQPKIHWISGYFFTQSFLTGILQNYARKYTIPIDKLTFDFENLGEPTNPQKLYEQYTGEPEDGCHMYGLYLEGCKWDYTKGCLEESTPKILHVIAPIIWLKPCEIEYIKYAQHYKCPVYKTAERKGVLSTTGHSTNFIMSINLNTEREEEHWIKRGVAMICQLSD